MNTTNWVKNEFGNYYSYHILIDMLGDETPKYHVLKLKNDNWVIGMFYNLYDEYVPLDETDIQINFKSSEEAMYYIDNILERKKN